MVGGVIGWLWRVFERYFGNIVFFLSKVGKVGIE